MLIFMFLLFADTTDPLAGKSVLDGKKFGMFGGGSSKTTNKTDTAAATATKNAGRGRSLTGNAKLLDVASVLIYCSV